MLPDYMASHSRKEQSSKSPPWKKVIYQDWMSLYWILKVSNKDSHQYNKKSWVPNCLWEYRNSSVDIMTTLHAWIAEESEFYFRQGKSFAPKHLTLTPHYIQWVTGNYAPRVKQLRHKNEHSPLPSAEVKNVWRYASIPPMPSSHGI
jgi:hypothetical protein